MTMFWTIDSFASTIRLALQVLSDKLAIFSEY
jgi:hypothetical protein